MEQIKFFGNEVDRDKVEMMVNRFICELGQNVEIKDVRYSHYNRDNSRWSAMVRYNDSHLDILAYKLKELRNQINTGKYNGKATGFVIANDDRIGNFVRMNMGEFSGIGYSVSNEVHLNSNWNKEKLDQYDYDKWWEQIQFEAYNNYINKRKIIIITTEDVRFFGMSERIIQLVKHEKPLMSGGNEFMFDGVVFIETKGIDWEQVEIYAKEHNAAEFEEMMKYYKPIVDNYK